MQLSIIVTSYKNPPLLELCLKSLKENVKNIDYEIIVADGETGEKTRDLMREKFPDIVFMANEKNVGFAVLVNQGIDKSTGDFLFIINGDIILKENAAKEMIDYLKENSDVGLVGPKLINFDNSIQPSCFRFYKPTTIIYRRTFLKRFGFAKRELRHFLMKDTVKDKEPIEADWIMGSAMMISRSALDQVGPISNEYFMYFEDVDWCWRFWEKGLKVVYHPGIKVYHYHGQQSANRGVLKALLFNRYARIHIYSAVKFFWKFKTLGGKNPHKSKKDTR